MGVAVFADLNSSFATSQKRIPIDESALRPRHVPLTAFRVGCEGYDSRSAAASFRA